MNLGLRLVTMAVLIVVMGCARSPRMSEADVIGLASRAAEGEGYQLGDYKAPQAHYTSGRKEWDWTVFFVMKDPAPPGGVIQIWVDDRTGKAELVRTD